MMYARMKAVVLCLVAAACAACAACASSRSEPARRQHEVRRDRPRIRGPVHTTAKKLFDDFTRPEADGLVLLDKYSDGATFTATIKTVGADENGTPVVWIDVDGENVMSLDFDEPVPRDLRAGAELTVTCKIGGASGALMMVTRCRS